MLEDINPILEASKTVPIWFRNLDENKVNLNGLILNAGEFDALSDDRRPMGGGRHYLSFTIEK